MVATISTGYDSGEYSTQRRRERELRNDAANNSNELNINKFTPTCAGAYSAKHRWKLLFQETPVPHVQNGSTTKTKDNQRRIRHLCA
jgi:hypothetical protein